VECEIIANKEVAMLKTKRKLVRLVLTILVAVGGIFFARVAMAGMEWKIIKGIDLKATPLDVSPSADGKWLFILTPGEILAYSFLDGMITDRVPVDKDLDRIASLPRANMVTVSSSTKNVLQIILLEVVQKIDMTGLPAKGPSEAPVVVAVFDDYQ
jgi:hypothetical protein